MYNYGKYRISRTNGNLICYIYKKIQYLVPKSTFNKNSGFYQKVILVKVELKLSVEGVN